MNYLLEKAGFFYKLLLGSVLGTMVAIVFVNVVLRKFFNSGLSFTEEALRYLFVWMSYLGIAAAYKTNGHIRMTMLTDRLPKKAQTVIAFVMNIAMFYALYFCASGGFIYIEANSGTYGELVKIPYYIVIAALIFACVSMMGMILLEMIAQIRSLMGKEAR